MLALSTVASAATAQPVAATEPFGDFRSEAPGKVHRIRLQDLPAPYATPSASNPPRVEPRPRGAAPQAPPGFRVSLYAEHLEGPRVLRFAPNGDLFVAESRAGRVLVLRGAATQGASASRSVFAEGLDRPYGIAFYPPEEPRWVYVGVQDAVLRFEYRAGSLKAGGEAERVASLPSGRSHWTRDLAFSGDGKTLFVAVGSASNVAEGMFAPSEERRADILAMRPDGTDLRIYASGLRNPSGIAVDPASGELWSVVNERDGLGDDLVPDYLTRVREGGFYGWPWWYMGPNQDPRHAGEHPELRSQVLTPDVLLQPHMAPLQLAFYAGAQFPQDYRGDIFATSHGSWNRSVRTGYEVIRVARHHGAAAGGEYEDFLTGFVLPDGTVWGRPVGVAVSPDGALLVSDDASSTIWRVEYAGPPAAAR
jgi:glucose/arabinose dehydrogenase